MFLPPQLSNIFLKFVFTISEELARKLETTFLHHVDRELKNSIFQPAAEQF